MKFEIQNRWSSAVQFECELSAEIETQSFGLRLGFAIKTAVKNRAILRDTDLSGAILRDTDLSGADLSGAILSDTDLRGAILRGAILRDTDLSGAILSDTDLSGADLSDIKSDLIAEILKLPNELEFLRAALVEGRVDGSTYSGECACLAGTLANAKGIAQYSGEEIAANGTPFKADAYSPRERWFLAIKKGDTPETNPAAKLALEWVDEAIAIRDHIRAVAP